jgi:CO dehydrogenase maturation factor
MVLGTIPQGGGGCFCPENVVLKSLLAHVFIEREEYLIVDMEAGLEHLGRGTTAYMDALIVVVEPGQRSFQTARQVKSLADDLGIKRVCVVGNKVTGPEDLSMMRESLSGFSFLGSMSYNEKIIEADKRGVSPYDIDPKIRAEVEGIIAAFEKEAG